MNNRRLFQMGMSYGQSLLAYRLHSGPRPFSAAFAVTNRCNLKCVYCEYPNMKTPELSLPEIEILFKNLRKIGVIRLGLLGGEPLVRKDFGDIVDLAKKMGFYVSVNTNLLLYHRFKDKLKNVDYFFTSLDGLPEKHIQNRGNQKYELIVEAIRDIVKQKKPITAICVLTSPDVDSVDYLVSLAEKESFNLHFQQECYDAKHAGRNSPQYIQQEEIRELWDYIHRMKKNGKPITSSNGYLSFIKEWEDYRKNAIWDPTTKCAAGRGFMFIDPSGAAFPCPYVQGSYEGVDMLSKSWSENFVEPPCSKCIVGPMLEFNLLYQKPLSSVREALIKIKS